MLAALDVGGTNIRVGFFENNKELKLLKHKNYKTLEFLSINDCINTIINEEKENIEVISIAAAGPVKMDICKLTNIDWEISVDELVKNFMFKRVYVLNDLKAAALGLKYLKESDFFVINSGDINRKENKCIISAGTGLGEAFICDEFEETLVLASEGGHCDFAPTNKLQLDLLNFLQKKYGHVSCERILSGYGLYNLYEFFREKKITTDFLFLENKLKNSSEPQKIITELALNKKNKTSEMILDLFVSVYASEAANAALKYFAVSGVFLGGGIAPKITAFMNSDIFMNSFINKGRFCGLMKSVPVKVILNENVSLFGAWHHAQISKKH